MVGLLHGKMYVIVIQCWFSNGILASHGDRWNDGDIDQVPKKNTLG